MTPTESFADLLQESLTRSDIRPGSVITGKVVHIDSDVVVVNAGLKSDAVISISEFRNHRGELEVSIGDETEVIVEQVEDGFGETLLSREKAKRSEAWDTLTTACDNSETVIGMISERVKGGFTVEVNSVRAFLPGSLVDVRPVRDPEILEGQELEFKIIKIDRKRNNIVVSRRAVLEEESGSEREALLETLEEGQVIDGIVKNITDYGAFVDLGGIDGLLHITDMSWKRVKHPSEVIKLGDEIKVKILRFDREKNRVSLGIKQLGEDPWVDITRRYPVGTRIFGKVTNLTDYGCFVEVEDGVEGLVHMSEMDWTNKNVHPSKIVQLGDETEVMVLDIDEERRRISLGIKQCVPNPWDEFAGNRQIDEKIKGNIKSITDFGIFIGLDGGIDGLVHMSDISWTEPGEVAVRNFKKGDEIEAIITGIDPERERISLSIRDMSSDPFEGFLAKYPKSSPIQGKVLDIDSKRAIVDLGDGIEGYLRAAELTDEIKLDQQIDAFVVGVDRKGQVVNLSLKEVPKDKPEAKAPAKAEAVANTTLGDLLREKMEDS